MNCFTSCTYNNFKKHICRLKNIEIKNKECIFYKERECSSCANLQKCLLSFHRAMECDRYHSRNSTLTDFVKEGVSWFRDISLKFSRNLKVNR